MLKSFKKYFLRGLAILVPTIITIWIFVWGYTFIQKNISIHINRGIVKLILKFQEDSGYTEEVLKEIWVTGPGQIAGFIIALLVVCIIGLFLASFIGKAIWRVLEKFILNTPFLNQIYPYVKQITDFVLSREEHDKMFMKAVAVEYPRQGIWSVGFVTGTGLKKVIEKVEKEFLSVLIPTSPTPFTGFVIMVPKEQTIELDITIEEAARFIISGGVITPAVQKADGLPKLQAGTENHNK